MLLFEVWFCYPTESEELEERVKALFPSVVFKKKTSNFKDATISDVTCEQLRAFIALAEQFPNKMLSTQIISHKGRL